jgi:hypothetical protein
MGSNGIEIEKFVRSRLPLEKELHQISPVFPPSDSPPYRLFIFAKHQLFSNCLDFSDHPKTSTQPVIPKNTPSPRQIHQHRYEEAISKPSNICGFRPAISPSNFSCPMTFAPSSKVEVPPLPPPARGSPHSHLPPDLCCSFDRRLRAGRYRPLHLSTPRNPNLSARAGDNGNVLHVAAGVKNY